MPPAALCVHLCIGMAYGFSVFWLPLTKAVGITQPVPCPPSLGLLGTLCFGFARARCTDCGHGFLVAFSCKGRGV